MNEKANKMQMLCSTLNTSYSTLISLLADHYCAEYIKNGSADIERKQISMDSLNAKIDSGPDTGYSGLYGNIAYELEKFGLNDEKIQSIYNKVCLMAANKAEPLAKAMYQLQVDNNIPNLRIKELLPSNGGKAAHSVSSSKKEDGTTSYWCTVNVKPELTIQQTAGLLSDIFAKTAQQGMQNILPNKTTPKSQTPNR